MHLSKIIIMIIVACEIVGECSRDRKTRQSGCLKMANLIVAGLEAVKFVSCRVKRRESHFLCFYGICCYMLLFRWGWGDMIWFTLDV